MAEGVNLKLDNNEVLERPYGKFKTTEDFQKYYNYNIPFKQLTINELTTYFKLYADEKGWKQEYYSQLAQKLVTFNLEEDKIKLEDYGFHILTKKEEEGARAFLEKNYRPPLRPAYHRDSWLWKDLNAELQYDIIKNKVFKDYNKIKTVKDIDNIIFIISQEDYENKYKHKIAEERRDYIDFYEKYSHQASYLIKIIPSLNLPIYVMRSLAEFIIANPGCDKNDAMIRDFRCIFHYEIPYDIIINQIEKARDRKWRALYLDKELDYATC